jgi:uncharacterized cupin superfamily protein
MLAQSTTTLLQNTVIPGVGMWSRWQPDRSLNFNSFFVGTKKGAENVLVDPLALDEEDLKKIESWGGIAWIVLTTRDHEREAAALAQRFKAKVAAPKLDVPEIKVKVDRELVEGDRIGRLTVVQLEGMKSPGEFALHLEDSDTVIVGDALWGDPPGSLRTVANEKLGNPQKAVLSLRRLWALEPKNILVGDGYCIFGGAMAAIEAFLKSRSDVLIYKINLDELAHWKTRKGPGRHARSQAEVGLLIGARKLGYQVFEVPPGNFATAMHMHTEEEELYIVFEGEGTIRFPFGEYPIRKGDMIAMQVGEQGTHRIQNTGKEKLVVFALANNADDDCVYYPDSDKLLYSRHVMRRMVSGNGGADLDAWHGEPG